MPTDYYEDYAACNKCRNALRLGYQELVDAVYVFQSNGTPDFAAFNKALATADKLGIKPTRRAERSVS